MTGPIMLTPLLLGTGRLLWSLVGGNPEGYLAVPLFMGLVIGSMIPLPEADNTRRGDRVLARIRSDRATLATAPGLSLSPSQLALGVALWGPRILEDGPLAQLGHVLRLARPAGDMPD